MTGYIDSSPIKGPPTSPSNLPDSAPDDHHHNGPAANRGFCGGGGGGGVARLLQQSDRPQDPSDSPTHGSDMGLGRVQARPSYLPEEAPITSPGADYDAPESYVNLDEVVEVSPIQNPDEEPIHRYESLEEVRRREQEEERVRQQQRRRPSAGPVEEEQQERERAEKKKARVVSRLATQIYTISYLVLFSILGTLARLGLQALVGSNYPGAPVIFPSLWPNFAGSLVMGFLAEDVRLFHHELNSSSKGDSSTSTGEPGANSSEKDEDGDVSGGGGSGGGGNTSTGQVLVEPRPLISTSHTTVSSTTRGKSHAAVKKTIPLYIGLATGFCGSLTSFSSFIRDVFLALSNDLTDTSAPRNGGYSLAAVLAVVLITLSLSLSGLFLGAHLAIALDPVLPALPLRLTRDILDKTAVILGFGAWLGALFLCIFPPDRNGSISSDETETWRGAVTFALVFAPLGCLLRFYLSLRMNSRVASFPLGTFTANILGTTILGVAWDLAHLPADGLSCQVLQGIQDGFCGCLTTVSTWVSELAVLRRRNAYVYGGLSVAVGLAMLVAIMGGMRWGSGDAGRIGFAELRCVHSFG